jgi:DNA polymerase
MIYHLDFETRSEVSLQNVGAWAYAQHPSTEILALTIGDHPSRLDTRGGFLYDWASVPPPKGFDGDAILTAHNVQFEYAIYNFILHKRYGWPAIWDPARWDCTMARALACGLPDSLWLLARVLKLKTQKDILGRKTMLELCAPISYDALGDPVFDNTPQKMVRLMSYNRVDVWAEMELSDRIPPIQPMDRAVFELDLLMNFRGIQIDARLAENARNLRDSIEERLNAMLKEMTHGEVTRHTQQKGLLQYLKRRGVRPLLRNDAGDTRESLDRLSRIEMLARPDLPGKIRAVLTLRHNASKSSSVAKYAKALEMLCSDGRIRGNLQYHGAHTGRWAGRLLQAQNFPKGFSDERKQAEAIDLILAGDAGALEAKYGVKAMGALSESLRGLILAKPEHKLFVADFSAVEARIVFWLAQDAAALKSYAEGRSPYIEMAQAIFKKQDITKAGTPQEYDLGKRAILGCGFGMGWAKFKGSVYAETAKATGTPYLMDDDLAQKVVGTYRTLHAPVVELWEKMETAAMSAIRHPSRGYYVDETRTLYWRHSEKAPLLALTLPSGRRIYYFMPSIKDHPTPWGEPKPTIFYFREDPVTHYFGETTTYGGALVENAVQAVARDFMAASMLRCEAAGFPLVLTVHDEVIAEVPDSAGKTLEEFLSIMCDKPIWGASCPIAAEGWIGTRYRK